MITLTVHALVVTGTEEEGFEYELIHPPDCPEIRACSTGIDLWTFHDRTREEYGWYECGEFYEFDAIGLDALGLEPGQVKAGTYTVRAWHEYDPFSREHDGGVEILNPSDG